MQIDWWTLALQAVNFLILIWLLSRFLYRPIVAIVAKRREAAQKLLSEAEAERAQVKAEHAEIAQIREGFAAERQNILNDARTQAEETRQALIVEAKEDAEKLLSDAEAVSARAEDAAQRTLAQKAEQLALAIAEKLLTRLQLQDATAAFLGGLCSKIESLSPQSKAALQKGGAMEVVTATALTSSQQARVRDALAVCLGGQPSPTFRTDPALIAGIELTSRDIVLRNSWREDLRTIREELGREEPDRDAAS